MRRSLRISFLIALMLLGGGLTVLYFMLRHEPEWYRHAAVPEGEERKRDSIMFEGNAVALHQQITQENREEWSFATTDKQFNSWLAEDFYHHKFNEQFGTPNEIRDIRVSFRNGTILVACRYGSESWNSVVSLEAQVWLSPSEPNVLGVQFENLRAGAVPFGIKSFQEQITEMARRQNIEVQWYRNEGKPVALLKFQSNRREPTFQLQEIMLRDGEFAIKGRSLDPTRGSAKRP